MPHIPATSLVHLPSIPLGCSVIRKPERGRENLPVTPARTALLTKLQSKRDAPNVSPSAPGGSVVGVLLALPLAERFSAPTWDPMCARKLFTTSSASACGASGIQWAAFQPRMCSSLGVFAYDCDLASSIKCLKAVGRDAAWRSRAASSS